MQKTGTDGFPVSRTGTVFDSNIQIFANKVSLKLLRPFYDEGLVDHRTFLTWIVLQMAACNLAQAGFVAHLADEYLDGVLEKRPLAKPLLDACIAKLNEVRLMVTYIRLSLTITDQDDFRSGSPKQA
jgi:hypothetical protein